MGAPDEAAVMSSAELKRQLYGQLRAAGVVDTVKTQMRTRLLAQLQLRDPELLERRVRLSPHDGRVNGERAAPVCLSSEGSAFGGVSC